MPVTAAQSLPLGIRFKGDADDARFMRYFNVVQQAAHKMGCVFFLDTVDDRCADTEDMDLGDLAGWLVPCDDAGAFSERFAAFDITDDDTDLYAFAIWELDEHDGLRVVFSD